MSFDRACNAAGRFKIKVVVLVGGIALSSNKCGFECDAVIRPPEGNTALVIVVVTLISALVE